MGILVEPYWLKKCLNEVRPGRPEQYVRVLDAHSIGQEVSMKSGLEDRNNSSSNPERLWTNTSSQ